jgi:hypothetical protein
VISFWFRIPQATIDAAKKQGEAYPASNFPTVFAGIIPLIAFGKQVKAPVIEGDEVVVGTQNVLVGSVTELQPVTEVYPVSSTPVPYAPSFIGIECRDDGNYIAVNLQTKDRPSISGVTFVNASVAPTPDAPSKLETDFILDDVSSAYDVIPQYYTGTSEAVKVSADEWHHIILSYDLTKTIATHGVHRDEDDGTQQQGTTSSNLMWYALDDVNYDELDLPANWVFGSSSPNAIISEQSVSACATPWHEVDPSIGPNHQYYPGGADGPASYSCPASSIPAEVLSIPSLATYNSGDGEQQPEHHVDMAELQIFTDMTLDTSKESNRRAFIDITDSQEDDAGKIILGPVPPDKTEERLNKRPDILLHGAGNWKSGNNTGSLGLEMTSDGSAGEIIPEGQFEPTGTIEKFSPDPSIKKGAGA